LPQIGFSTDSSEERSRAVLVSPDKWVGRINESQSQFLNGAALGALATEVLESLLLVIESAAFDMIIKGNAMYCRDRRSSQLFILN
jgi:hypothetical protein